MYFIFNNPIKLSITVYLLVAFIIIYNKPDLLFHQDGTIRGFGCAEESEFFNFPVILYSFTILITFCFESLSIHQSI